MHYTAMLPCKPPFSYSLSLLVLQGNLSVSILLTYYVIIKFWSPEIPHLHVTEDKVQELFENNSRVYVISNVLQQYLSFHFIAIKMFQKKHKI